MVGTVTIQYVTDRQESDTPLYNLRLPFDRYWIVLRDRTVAACAFQIFTEFV